MNQLICMFRVLWKIFVSFSVQGDHDSLYLQFINMFLLSILIFPCISSVYSFGQPAKSKICFSWVTSQVCACYATNFSACVDRINDNSGYTISTPDGYHLFCNQTGCNMVQKRPEFFETKMSPVASMDTFSTCVMCRTSIVVNWYAYRNVLINVDGVLFE